jgi:hypothetical protein
MALADATPSNMEYTKIFPNNVDALTFLQKNRQKQFLFDKHFTKYNSQAFCEG